MLIGIVGKGKMGRLIESTALSKGIEVAGCFDIYDHDQLRQNVDVLVDFSHRDNLEWVVEYTRSHRNALVYGTTGLSEQDLQTLKSLSKEVPVFYSANYSLGIAVLKSVLEKVTPLLEEDFDIEILEKHHNQKKDAPSGTALSLLEAVDPQDQYEHVFGRQGMTGARKKEIGVHALRGGTIAGEHTVYFCGPDEILSFSHEALSRQIFVNGALKAVLFLEEKPAGFYTMKELIGE